MLFNFIQFYTMSRYKIDLKLWREKTITMPKFHAILPVYLGYDINNPKKQVMFDRYRRLIATVSYLVGQSDGFYSIYSTDDKKFNLTTVLDSHFGLKKRDRYITNETDINNKIRLYTVFVPGDYFRKVLRLQENPQENLILSSNLKQNKLNWHTQIYMYNNVTGFNKIQNNIFKFVLEENTFLPSVEQVIKSDPEVVYGNNFEACLYTDSKLREIQKNIYQSSIVDMKRFEKFKNELMSMHPNFHLTYEKKKDGKSETVIKHVCVVNVLKKKFLKVFEI